MSIDYTHGYRSSFYATILDAGSWSENKRLEIINGSVDRTNSDLRQSAKMTMTSYDQTEELWIRVYMDARQGQDISHDAIFTGIATSPSKKIDGNVTKQDIECFSVLKPLQDIILPRGWYIAAGSNAGDVLRELFQDTPAPNNLNDDDIRNNIPAITDYIIAEDNDSELSMVDKVLKAIGWELIIDGTGMIIVRPKQVEAAAKFGVTTDIVEKTIDVKKDWFSCPNIFRATSDDVVAIARDDNPYSYLSTVGRGRDVIAVENDVTLNNGEGLAEYAERRLKEEQSVVEQISYDRRFLPNINIGDIVIFDYKQLTGTYKITSQTINLTYGGKTSEDAENAITEIPLQTQIPVPAPARDGILIMPDEKALIIEDDKYLTIDL